MKSITVVVAATNQVNELAIKPGTTAKEILQQMNLPDSYVLTSGRGQEPWGADENVYAAVVDGAKVYASTPVEVGFGPPLPLVFLCTGAFVWYVLRCLGVTKKTSRRSGLSSRNLTSLSSLIPAYVNGRPVVQQDNRPYWAKRGWCSNRHGYSGWYRTKFGSWEGLATKSPSGAIKLYIHKPPRLLGRHPKAQCFFSQGNGWYLVHTHGPRVRDLNSGIMRVEQILAEAHRG